MKEENKFNSDSVYIPLKPHLFVTTTADVTVFSLICPWAQQGHLRGKFPKNIGKQSSFLALVAAVMAGTWSLQGKGEIRFVLGASAQCNMSWKRLSSAALLIIWHPQHVKSFHHSLLVCILPTVRGMSLCNNITLYEHKPQMRQALQRKPLIWLQGANLTEPQKVRNV